MKPPVTFAEWSDIFDRLKENGYEEELLEAVYSGTFSWDPGSSELWAEDFAEVLGVRIEMAKKRFDRDLSHSRGNEGAIVRSLTQLKKDLRYALKLSQLPCIPDEQKPLYADIVQKAAEQFASSLESSARSEDRSGKLSVLVKKTDISNLN